MHHVSLAAIGRRATIEAHDSLSDSFEKRSSRETASKSPEFQSSNSSPSRVLCLDEVVMHLKTVECQLRALHASRAQPKPHVSSQSIPCSAGRDVGHDLSF